MEFSWKEYWSGLPFPSPIIQYYNLICNLNSDLSNYNELCSLGLLFDSGFKQGLHIIFIYIYMHGSYRKEVKLQKLDSGLINQVNNKKAGRVSASRDDKL